MREFIAGRECHASAKPSLEILHARHRFGGAMRSAPRAHGESRLCPAVPPRGSDDSRRASCDPRQGDHRRATRAIYFKRIAAYNGTCVKGEVDPATGLMLGEITPIENAGQVNAYMTLNIRGKRSKTDPADNDPTMPDALETARAQDAYFARTGNFVGPLHGIPIAVKDNYDTIDMRTTAGAIAEYANDKLPKDATMVARLRAAGAIILGKTNLDEYAPAGIGRSTLGGQTCNPYDTKR
ncbi:MAG TPA: amidase family protein, partial [Gemmataceae bacterium]|nr:amidase family protein [Gemmataceae bacterium]